MEENKKIVIDKTYDSRDVEEKWYKFWIDGGYSTVTTESKKTPYSIVIPPPNVTGSLHIGHALNNTLQDILIRYKRMRGYEALWMPGTDHAGIATQLMVERELETEGINRGDLSRNEFVDRVWRWKSESGNTISRQLRRLGAMPDWSRERFTMDEGLSFAVRKVFVDLFKDGLIYRDKRLVNWDPILCTAISDLEVEQREVKGHLWHFKYPLEGRKDEFITVATTRPETMLGDTAVAVHPDDSRYTELVGRFAILPLVGRRIPIIADTYSDPAKGSGAVKITPAHDFNDFEVGRRHHLEMINIFDARGNLNENVPKEYAGLNRFKSRNLIVADVESLGLLDKTEDTVHTVPYGDRSGEILEPWLTDQWYVDAKILAQEAIRAVEDGRIKFHPRYWENTYFEWMRNIQPWCISRQIWWGHQIPAWYGPDGRFFVELTEDEAKSVSRRFYGEDVDLTRDPDVLDTWFSSALWPFSTLGWPEGNEELRVFYPTTVLVTGFDIIFFWVARMIMMGLKFTGDVPFREVYIHGLIRDEKGQKMSKTKGNVIDPIEIIDQYGADALRFSLTALATQGRDIKLSISIIKGYRNFMNKIWNAFRFIAMNLNGYDPDYKYSEINLSKYDKWILTKLSNVLQEVEVAFENYEFDKIAHNIYQFIWGDFTDWYIEYVKPILYGHNEKEKQHTQSVLVKVLLSTIRALHPVAPFITEEIFQKIRGLGVNLKVLDGELTESIMTSAYPTVNEEEIFNDAHDEIDFIKEIVVAVRNLRAVVGVHPSDRVRIIVLPESSRMLETIESNKGFIMTLAGVSSIEFEEQKPDKAVTHVMEGLELYLPVDGLIDVEKEVARLKKEIEKVVEDIQHSEKKLSNSNFLERAPQDVVEKEKEKFEELSVKRQKLEEVSQRLSEI